MNRPIENLNADVPANVENAPQAVRVEQQGNGQVPTAERVEPSPAHVRAGVKKRKPIVKKAVADEEVQAQANAEAEAEAQASQSDSPRSAASAEGGASGGDASGGETSVLNLSTMSQNTQANFGTGAAIVFGSLLIGASLASGGTRSASATKGYLIDSPVAGVDYYINGVFAGKTAADGSFAYKAGDRVTFKIGNVTLADNVLVPSDQRVFMQDLAGVSRSAATDPKVVRLAQLLQSLDADNDPDNGITIDATRLRDDLAATSIDDETVVRELLDDDVKMVSEADALDHVNDNAPHLKNRDDTAPTAVVTVDSELVARGESAVVTVTFSEPVKIWAEDGALISVTGGGAVSGLVSSDGGKTYTGTYTPPSTSATGTATLTLGNAFTDMAGNRGIAPSDPTTVAFDTQAPTATLTGPNVESQRANAETADTTEITFVSTEAGRAYLVHSSINVSGGVSALTDTNATLWNSVAVPTPDSAVSVTGEGLADGQYALYVADVHGNLSTPITQVLTIDRTRPEVTIVSSKSGSTTNGEVTYTFTFSEAVTGFTAEDITVENGSKGAFSFNGTSYTLIVYPNGGEEGADLGVVVGTGFVDGFGNAPAATTRADAQAYDTYAPDAPTVSLKTDTGQLSTDLITNLAALTVATEEGASVEYSADGDTWLTTAPTPTNGENIVHVRQIDQAGNASGRTSFSFTFDTQVGAPTVALVDDTGSSDSDALTNDGALTVTDTEPSAIIEYSTDQQSWSTSAPAPTAGSNTVYVRQTDVAGNVSAAQSFTFTFDTVVAAPTLSLEEDTSSLEDTEGNLLSNTDLITRNPQINVGALEDGGTWEYQIDGTGDWISGVGTSFNAIDGEHSYVVRQTDAAGNTNTSEPFTVTALLSIQAANVTLVSGTGEEIDSGITTDEEAVLRVSGSEGDVVRYRFVSANAPIGGWTELDGEDTIALGEGLVNVETQRIDIAGNFVNTLTRVVKDSTAATPVMTLDEDTETAGDGITTNPMVTVTGYEGGAVWQVRIDDSPYWNVTTEAPNKFRLELGTHTYHIRQTDRAGNVSEIGSYTFTYQSEVPQPTLALAEDTGVSNIDGITSVGTMSVGGLQDGATWQFKIDDGEWQTGTGSTIYLVDDGDAHLYSVRQQVGGKWSEPTLLPNILLDNIAPTAPVVALVSDSGDSNTDNITNVADIEVSGLELGATLQYSVDGGDWTGLQITQTDATLSLEPGTHSYKFRVIDAAGNASEEITRDYTYLNADVAAPALAIFADTGASPLDGQTSNGRIDVTLALAANGVSWQYQVDGGEWINGTGTSFTAQAGSHDYKVRSVDIAGNTSPASAPLTVNFDTTAPTFTSATSARVADPDSERNGTISNTTALYTAQANDDSPVVFTMAQNETFTFDAATGTLYFKQPVGYIFGGDNAYSAQLIATDAAGNQTTQTVTITVDPTNTATPSITLADPRNGITELEGVTTTPTLMPDGTIFIVKRSGSVSTLHKVDGNGDDVAGFTPLQLPATAAGGIIGSGTASIDANGKIVFTQPGGSGSAGGVARLNADGTIDTTFGANGSGFIPSPNATPGHSEVYYSSATDANGTVTFVGLRTTGGNTNSGQSIMATVSSNGTVSPTQVFNINSNDFDSFSAITLGGPGTVYVTVKTETTTLNPTLITRDQQILKFVNGTQVSGFAINPSAGTTQDYLTNVAVDSQGRLIVGQPVLSGTVSYGTSTTSMRLYRYNANGSLDTTFGSGGVLTVSNIESLNNITPFSEATVRATIKIAADDSIYIQGNIPGSATQAQGIWHVTSSGALDTNFGTNGVYTPPFNPTSFVVTTGGDLTLYQGAPDAKLHNFNIVGGKPVYDSSVGGPSLTFTESGRPVVLLTNASNIFDADNASTNYDGVSLKIERADGPDASDQFGTTGNLQFGETGEILWNLVVVGTYTNTGGTLNLVFNEGMTQPILDQLTRSITYRSSSQNLPETIDLAWTMNDNAPTTPKSFTAKQTIVTKNDNTDPGDLTMVTTANNTPVTLDNMIEVNGKLYYVITSYPEYSGHNYLDKLFNNGQDTTVNDRAITRQDGSVLKLLTAAEITALMDTTEVKADGFWSNIFTPQSVGNEYFFGVWAADQGNGADQHLVRPYWSSNFQSTGDEGYDSYFAIVEVTPGAPSVDTYVAPALRLVSDNGASATDRITSDARIEVVGLSKDLPLEFSTDGGQTWTSYPAGTTVFELPEGSYVLGQVRVRQTDASGIQELVRSTTPIEIDRDIRAINIFNDQGQSDTDNNSADGRMVVTGYDPAYPVEYSLNGGGTWLEGGMLGFSLANGTYAAGSILVRQFGDDATIAQNTQRYVIDSTTGQGKVTLLSDNGDSATDGLTSDDRIIVRDVDHTRPLSYSLDGGITWTVVADPAGETGFVVLTVPAGNYDEGKIVIKQADDKGYEALFDNRQFFIVDKSVRNLGMLNDQGVSLSDRITADGRMVATGLDVNRAYQYSTDNGSTWQSGSYVNGVPVFTLPQGTYAAQAVQVRQTLDSGAVVTVRSNGGVVVSTTEGQGAITLSQDTGGSATDGITTSGRISITGISGSMPWEYSLNGGTTWIAGTGITGQTQSLSLPEGSYAAGSVLVRQTDAKGFVTTVASTSAYTVDSTIASANVSLVLDNGFKTDDFLTQDGRVRFDIAGSLNAGDSWTYTTDGGKTWQAGTGTTLTVDLADGVYNPRTIQVKVTDVAGNASLASLDKRLVVDGSDTAAPVFTSPDRAFATDFDGTGTNSRVETYAPVLTVRTTDANAVYYSLTGQHAHLFSINAYGQISFKEPTNLINPLGDMYQVTAVATDAWNNVSTQDVTIGVVERLKYTGTNVANPFTPMASNTFEITFSHPIEVNSTGTVKFVMSNGTEVVLDINDPTQVRTEGNRLILSVEGLTQNGYYTLRMTDPIKSTLTGQVMFLSRWDSWTVNIDDTVEYRDGKLNPTGSYMVGAIDGNTEIGKSVIIGDVNGDGIDDWATSAPSANGSAGKIYVVYGRADGVMPQLSVIATNTGGFLLTGTNGGDLAGTEISAAGDVNGDGYADIAIMAPGANGGNGKGYVVFGGANNSNMNLATVEGNGNLGRVYTNSVKDSLNGVGDINGDGRDDVAHGRVDLQRTTVLRDVNQNITTYIAPGKIVVKANWLNYAMNWVDAASRVAAFFDDPLTATIENGANWEENLELAMQDEDGSLDDFSQAVIDLISKIKAQLPANQSIDSFTYTQSGGGGGGLLNPPKDTVYDFKFTIKVVSTTTTTWTTTLFGAGEVVIELGAAGTKQITGTINGQQVGSDVVALGDVNGDGRADYGVLDTGSGGVLAKMNVVYGSASNEELFTNNFDRGIGGFRITDPTRSVEYVGEGNISGLGDINGDGINDFALTLDSVEAATYIVYGQRGMAGVDLSQVRNGVGGFMLNDAWKRSSTQVEAIGDFNGDGIDDFVYYSVGNGLAQTYNVYVVYGGATAPNFASFNSDTLAASGRGFTIEGTNFANSFGARNSVSAGDINGDGLTDLVMRGANGETLVLTGSNTSGKAHDVTVDRMGTAGHDVLVSGGTQFLVGGLGNDTITAVGADVVHGGAGNDRIIIGADMIAALGGGLGSNGNIGQLSKVDGGGGIDTLQLSGGASLDLRSITNKLMDMDNISSRLSSIEKIDMATDSAANTLNITLTDVLDMGSANAFNLNNGWQNQSGGALSGTTALHQVAIDGGSNDRVELRSAEWTMSGAAVVDTATGNVYDVYSARNGVAAQLLIDKDAGIVWA